MSKKYSAATSGFYTSAIHGSNIPADAVEITDEQHAALLVGQSQGKLIVADENGYPILQDPVVIPVVHTQFSSLAFLDRFTQAEQLSVVQATMVSAEVKLWYDRLLAADFVDLTDPRTEAGVDALIMAGLIDPSRKLEILTP